MSSSSYKDQFGDKLGGKLEKCIDCDFFKKLFWLKKQKIVRSISLRFIKTLISYKNLIIKSKKKKEYYCHQVINSAFFIYIDKYLYFCERI